MLKTTCFISKGLSRMFKIVDNGNETSVVDSVTGNVICTVPKRRDKPWGISRPIPRRIDPGLHPITGPGCRILSHSTSISVVECYPSSASSLQLQPTIQSSTARAETPEDVFIEKEYFKSDFVEGDDKDINEDCLTKEEFLQTLGLIKKQKLQTVPLQQLRQEFPLRAISQVKAGATFFIPSEDKVYDDTDVVSPLGRRWLEKTRLSHRHTVSESTAFAHIKKYDNYCRFALGSPYVNGNFPKLRCRELKMYPLTFRPSKSWANGHHHVYCFSRQDRIERLKVLRTGLTKRSRKLKTLCKNVVVRIKKISKEEIVKWTAPKPKPVAIFSFIQRPMLSPQIINITTVDINQFKPVLNRSHNFLHTKPFSPATVNTQQPIQNRSPLINTFVVPSKSTTNHRKGMFQKAVRVPPISPRRRCIAKPCKVLLWDCMKCIVRRNNGFFVTGTKIRVRNLCYGPGQIPVVKPLLPSKTSNNNRNRNCHNNRNNKVHSSVEVTFINNSRNKGPAYPPTAVVGPYGNNVRNLSDPPDIKPKIADLLAARQFPPPRSSKSSILANVLQRGSVNCQFHDKSTPTDSKSAADRRARSRLSRSNTQSEDIPVIDISSDEEDKPYHAPLIQYSCNAGRYIFSCFGCSSNNVFYSHNIAEQTIRNHMERFHAVTQPNSFLEIKDKSPMGIFIEAFPGYKK